MIADALILLAGSVAASNLALTGQLVTAVGATAGNSTADLGPPAANQGFDAQGQSIDVAVRILQTLTSAGAATVRFQLVQADDAALSVNAQVLTQTDDFPYALLTAGTSIPMRWAPAAPYVPRRYVGIRTVIGGAVLTNATGWLVAVVAADDPTMYVGKAPLYKSGIPLQP